MVSSLAQYFMGCLHDSSDPWSFGAAERFVEGGVSLIQKGLVDDIKKIFMLFMDLNTNEDLKFQCECWSQTLKCALILCMQNSDITATL